MAASGETDLRFEPLADHDRASFSCGIPELDNYLYTQASQDARWRVAAPFVMVDGARQVLGYYTLSAYGVRPVDLPQTVVKKLAKYPLLPATLLGRLAIPQEHRGRKLGRLLLMDALERSWKNTSEVASVGALAVAMNEAARDFYLHHEFLPLLDQPNRLFISMGTLDAVFSRP